MARPELISGAPDDGELDALWGVDPAQAEQTVGPPDDSELDATFGDAVPANGQRAMQLPTTTIEAEPEGSAFERFADSVRESVTGDGPLAFARGAGFGQVNRMGEWLGEKQADLDYPVPEGTTRVGAGPSASIPVTPTTEAADAAGTMGMGAAASILAGPGLAAQGAVGAALGGARGESEGGLSGLLSGGLTGGLTGLAGGMAAKYLPGIAQKAKEILPDWAKAGALMTSPLKAGVPLAAAAALRKYPKESATALRAAGGAASGLGGRAAGFLTGALGGADDSTAHAQEKAYHGTPTTSWAVQSVLSSGTSGLPEDAEQRLTEAVMSGDPARVVSTNFVLSQRFPAYAKRMTDEYKALQER